MPAKAQPHATQIRIWDGFIRFFHWSLVVGFATSFFSGEFDWMTVHVWTGYGLCGLLTARLIWGVIGSKYARFGSFIYSLSETRAYVRGMLQGKPPHYLGHNPLGALMVFALLGMCLLICLSGLLTLATLEFEGPLVVVNRWFDDAMAYAVEDIHETLPLVTLALVGLHVAGVVIASRLHGENLIKSMMTGNKPMPSSAGHHQQAPIDSTPNTHLRNPP